MNKTQNYTDIIRIKWVESFLPKLKPYFYLMRLDRPIGTWLLLLPGWWAILLAGALSAWKTMCLFAVGALVMRGAGCVVNDLWDRDLDGQVERTAIRPLPAGDISPMQAFVFLGFLFLIGLIILLQFNWLTIALGMISVVFIGLYPLMKRITWWPQAFLGMTFNFGALMGWGTVSGELPWQAWVLYASGFFWTLGYDTIYALQDKDDDALVGIKSTARLFLEKWKGNVKIPLYVFYTIHFILMMVVLFSFYQSVFLILAFLPFGHLVWQVRTISTIDPHNALKRFKSNRDYGFMICAIIVLLNFM